MKLLAKRGQSTGEYAILFAIVLGAVFAVQNFVRHHIAGNLKAQADDYVVTSQAAATSGGFSTDDVNGVVIDTTADTAQRTRMNMQSASDGIAATASNTFSVSNAIQ